MNVVRKRPAGWPATGTLSPGSFKPQVLFVLKAALGSYSQVFFSSSRAFGLVLLTTTFIDPGAGVCGLVCVVASIATAWATGFDPLRIAQGTYGYNSLLVGLGLGVCFSLNYHLLFVVILAAWLTVLLNVTLEAWLGKYALPFLSVPFLAAIWTLTLAAKSFGHLHLSLRGLFPMNEALRMGGGILSSVYALQPPFHVSAPLREYFLSLGAILFQSNWLAGVLVAAGILVYSRIAFVASVAGFAIAYWFYWGIGVDTAVLGYSCIGYNYILSSIAISSIFLVPSPVSFLAAALLIPLTAIIAIAVEPVLGLFNLAALSLPFNVVVLLFLYALKLRIRIKGRLFETPVQHLSPEKNMYSFLSASNRFAQHCFPISLPFWGERVVTQGIDGAMTHSGDYRHAWDFEISDTKGKTFSGAGTRVKDYYCFDKPVLAPADGFIEEVVDGVEDNAIGDVNSRQNWGNMVVIRHGPALFSLLCHLGAGTIGVSKGAFVKRGQHLAKVGNSGRSPVPHLHFQVQAYPAVGSPTISYPFSHYTVKKNGATILREYALPEKDEVVAPTDVPALLKNAFAFKPGQRTGYAVTISTPGQKIRHTAGVLSVMIDMYNNHYFHDDKTDSSAWFYNDGMDHYFKNYLGGQWRSFAYYLFLALYKSPASIAADVITRDVVPVHLAFSGIILWVQDFVAPFFLFLKAEFELSCVSVENVVAPSRIVLESKVTRYFFRKKIGSILFRTEITDKGVVSIQGTSGVMSFKSQLGTRNG